MSASGKWEGRLRTWSKPANEVQEARANQAADEVRSALSDYTLVPNSVMKVAAQGSKLNNTDTEDDSDVDIRVELHLDKSQPEEIPPIFVHGQTKLAKGLTDAELGLRSVQLPVSTKNFKDHIHQALLEQFGGDNVDRHDKCLKVATGGLTFPTDVVPCLPYRLYVNATDYESGIAIFPDSGGRVINFPEQHYRNGVAKNEATRTRFKKMVRCLKRMENELCSIGQLSQGLPSFFIESLVYNCPNRLFLDDSYVTTFLDVTLSIFSMLHEDKDISKPVEANGIKTLFCDGQSWTRSQGRKLAALAWYRIANEIGIAA